MKIGIIGSGHVGLVTGACFADLGNDVICMDTDTSKIDRLLRGEIPIFEPGLDELVKRNVEEERLRFSTDMKAAVAHGLMQFIAVGTPPGEDGSADLQYVLAVAREIGRHMDSFKVVVDNRLPEEKSIRAGRHVKLRANEKFNILLRDAGAVRMTLNDKPFSIFGASGQPVNVEIP